MEQGSERAIAPEAADFGAFEHAAWTGRAEGYERHFEGVVEQAIEPLLDAAGVRSGLKVLDVACGPGFVAAAAARRGASVVGVDFSDRMLAIARARYPWLRFEHGDAEDLPFADDSFDAVTINFGILHFPHPLRALKEAFRVLRPQGALAFTDWAAPGPDNVAYDIVLSAMDRHAEPFALPPGPPLFQFARAAACREALADTGFERRRVDTRLLRLTWRLASADGLVSAFRDGSARLAAKIAAQPPARLAAIRAEVAERSLAYRTQDGFAIPAGAALTRARKPTFAAAPTASSGALADA
ncbi:MAG TPA: methyltransferase domain-containing protein [Beijerinckiaceae bacterium]|jgi:SAM-dependent methyltransferase